MTFRRICSPSQRKLSSLRHPRLRSSTRPKEAKEVVTFDDSQTPAEKKQPIIEVKKKDMDMVSTVVKTTQKQEKQASDECEMAKKQARDKAAGATKEERHKAMKAVEKYCDKVTGDVSKEESEAVTDLTGKKDAPQTEKDAAKKERALFKKDLGSKVAVTGHKAEQMGKDQAAAKALKTMADKQHDKDQGLAIDACAKAHQMAKIAGGKKTKKGRKLLKKATKYCSTLAGVIVKEGQQIAKSVRDTAQGKVGVEDAAAGMSQGVSDEQAASLKHKAEQACDEAKSKVEEQVKAVPADKRKALRAKAMAMADALCDNVQKEVQQAIDNNAAAIDGAASASDADDDDDDEPAIDGDAIDGAASASDAPLAALKAKGDEACEHAKHMATEVAGSADEKAKAHDMAKELCKKVADAVKKEAKKEGLTGADADAESAGADMDPDKMKVIKAKADAACQHAKNMAKHLPSGASPAQKASSMAMAQALCKKVEGLVSKAEGQSGADEDSADAPPAGAYATLKAQGQEACDHAKAMVSQAKAADKKKVAAMADELCKKVDAALAKEAKREGLSADDQDAPTGSTAPSGSMSAEKLKAFKAKADAACDHAKQMATKIATDASDAQKAAAKLTAKTLCDKVHGLVAKAAGQSGDVITVDADSSGDSAASPLAALKAKGDEACEHAKHMATEVAGSADEKAKAHDMAKELCKKVADAVKKEAKKEGLTDDDADAESAGADMDPDKMKVIKAKADAACQHAKNMAKHLPSQATGAQKVATMAMAKALCKKVEGLVTKAEGQSGAEEDSVEDSDTDDGSTVDIAKYAMDKKAMAQAEH